MILLSRLYGNQAFEMSYVSYRYTSTVKKKKLLPMILLPAVGL